MTIKNYNISIVSWKDNDSTILYQYIVIIIINLRGGPTNQNNRKIWPKRTKTSDCFGCPKLIKKYNSHFGDINLIDTFLGHHGTKK